MESPGLLSRLRFTSTVRSIPTPIPVVGARTESQSTHSEPVTVQAVENFSASGEPTTPGPATTWNALDVLLSWGKLIAFFVISFSGAPLMSKITAIWAESQGGGTAAARRGPVEASQPVPVMPKRTTAR